MPKSLIKPAVLAVVLLAALGACAKKEAAPVADPAVTQEPVYTGKV